MASTICYILTHSLPMIIPITRSIVIVFITLDWIFVLTNTTTMISWRCVHVIWPFAPKEQSKFLLQWAPNQPLRVTPLVSHLSLWRPPIHDNVAFHLKCALIETLPGASPNRLALCNDQLILYQGDRAWGVQLYWFMQGPTSFALPFPTGTRLCKGVTFCQCFHGPTYTKFYLFPRKSCLFWWG